MSLVTAHRMQTFSVIIHLFLYLLLYYLHDNIRSTSTAIEIRITDKIKTSGKNKVQPLLILPIYEDKKVCVASTLSCYLEKTKEKRGSEKHLLIANKKHLKS